MLPKISAARIATTAKYLIPIPVNRLHPLRNHHHRNQIPTQFHHFSFHLLPPNLHLHLRLHPFRMSSQASTVPPPDSSSSSSTPIKTVKVVIKGRVQGVFYRNWTVENATELGLKGWVRNRRDGSVEALFSGSADKVEQMQERCRRGPPAAMVTGLNVSPCDEDPGKGFQRLPTV